jgi:hypothetical protein
MGLASELQSAFSEAHTAIAQAGGMSGSANALYQGQPYAVVFGSPQVQRIMLPSGGYRQRTVVPFSVSKEVMVACPANDTNIVRTDVSPHITYRVDSPDKHDAYSWRATLVRVGE